MPALEALMPSADLYLLPTDSESFGLSALEAQACGVPVLGYAVGGLPEVVEHGVTGFLRTVGDVDGLAEDGTNLLLDETRYGAMAAASRERATRLFDADRIVSQYLEIYDRVLSAA
jgi:glycosyltransferase involved in cell wall biosynthesis